MTATVEALQAELAMARAELVDLRATAERLYHETTHDELTGLLKRKVLAQAWAGDDIDWPDGVALVDLDRFKEINDTYGHAAGDAVLQYVARDLADRYRIVARLGGDELVVVDARQTIRDLADDGLTWHVPTGATVLTVTATIGCVRVYRSQRTTLAYADRAMYRAKAAGRGSSAWATADDDAPVVERPRVRLRDTRSAA